jgi:anti-anti-sigma regulatory factor
MLFTISTHGQQVVLTVTPDLSINSSNLYQTDFLLDHAMSSSVSCIVFNLSGVSCLNAIGSWTMFQVVFKAQEYGKVVFFSNVQPSVRPLLEEAGILTMVSVIETQEELDRALRGKPQTPKSAGTLPQPGYMHGTHAEGF